MCNRFGSDNHAPIRRLSTEVVDMITMEMLSLEYAESFSMYDQLAACFEDRCKAKDHFNAAELQDYYQWAPKAYKDRHRTKCGPTCQLECYEGFQNPDEESSKELPPLSELLADEGATDEVHHARAHEWYNKINEDDDGEYLLGEVSISRRIAANVTS